MEETNMSVKGLDTYSNVSNCLTNIKNQGYSFVARYYSKSGNSKRMTAAEAAAIGSAGLKRVVVYQNIHQSYDKFSASIASIEAGDAIGQAQANGQPSSVIYFAVDYDATSSEIDGNITEHFRVLKNMLSQAGYSTGVYGSSLVCKKLKEAGLVTKTWLAKSSGWGHGTSFSDWNIKQGAEVVISGITFDSNTASSLSNIGGW